jgi:hypothetical protein
MTSVQPIMCLGAACILRSGTFLTSFLTGPMPRGKFGSEVRVRPIEKLPFESTYG